MDMILRSWGKEFVTRKLPDTHTLTKLVPRVSFKEFVI